jgi:hypothetical protein
VTVRKSTGYTIGDQAVSASPTPRKRTAAVKSTTARKQTESNAAKVRGINTARKAADDKIAEIVKESEERSTATSKASIGKPINKSTAAKLVMTEKGTTLVPAAKKSTAKKSTAKSTAVETPHIDEMMSTLRGVEESQHAEVRKLAQKLAELEASLLLEDVSGRTMPAGDDAPKTHKDRDETVRKLRALGVGYDFIARLRMQPSSSNRGQVRLMCGLSRWDRVSADTQELTAAQRGRYSAAKEQGMMHEAALKTATAKRGAK